MQEKLFVGGLSWNTDEASLKSAFESFGVVVEAKIITDRESGRSRGFGFVTMDAPASAAKAIEGMDGAELDGRTIKVDVAQAKKPRGGGGGGGGRW
jgi:RNA recognition motif-containing protein